MVTEKNVSNRLAAEKSPYLLQHAGNPVDWWPWCDEAFAKASAEDKPIFLSIGYSTCHWCHVMARESFEDEGVARALNDAFVSIKLDREERPDIDAVYMEACMAMNGSGGWPLTVLMTPDGKPFFTGTYFPRSQFLSLLDRVRRLWRNDREALAGVGERLAGHLAQEIRVEERAPGRALIARAASELKRSFSEGDGGFGGPPRFPMPHNLMLLMDHARADGDAEALRMAERQLEQMYRGGLFDHVGGGFSRYATDRRWLIPHFEKMLYDNALLLYAYAEAYARTRRPLYREVVMRTADYALNELLRGDGGFMSAQDADSEGGEGAYYVFTRAEAEAACGRTLCDWYGLTERGNFEGKNILNLLDNPGWEDEPAEIAPAREKLKARRATRAAPDTDGKVLAAWNGLMIAGLARAARALHEPRFTEAALSAWDFVQSRLRRPDGRLYVRWAAGEAAGEGLLDDYAFLAWGLIELYRATYDLTLLTSAAGLLRIMIERFGDEGGFYLNAEDAALIRRPREFYDGALPSGNAVAGHALSELARYTAGPFWRDAAERQMRVLSARANAGPSAHAFALWAMGRYLMESNDLLCACAGEAEAREAAQALKRTDDPSLYALIKTPGNADDLAELAPFTRDIPTPESGALYYRCAGGACRLPKQSLSEALD